MKNISKNDLLKILIPTPVAPPKKDALAMFVDNVICNLQNKIDTELVWLIHQPQKISVSSATTYDIHDFYDAKDLLEKINPSCIILTPTYEPINYSISIAANFLKIPLISVYLYDYEFTYRKTSNSEYVQYLKSFIRRIFSNKVPTESEYEKQFMKRGRFMLYKYYFLVKTKRTLGFNSIKIIRNLIQDFIMFITRTYPEYNLLADLNILPNESWFGPLINYGIPKEKLSITGNPFWDNKCEKIQNRISEHANKKNNKIRILILTDSLVEHGLWSYAERDCFLEKLFTELKNNNNVSFALKIHPSSENKIYYESLLSKFKIEAQIFQLEDLWDIMGDFDIVLSYGTTYAHTELSSGTVKLILLDPKNEFVRQPLVKEGTECGHVVICTKFEDLLPSIHKLLHNEIHLTDEFLRGRQKLYFKFDGKSGERVADEIIRIANKSSITSN